MQPADYKKAIKNALEAGQPLTSVARRIYLCYPTFSFLNMPDREFDIKNSIANEHHVAISDIHFGGSGKTGESYHKEKSFEPGTSDLDAAIVNARLFLTFLEDAVATTEGFKDFTSYDKRVDDVEEFTLRLQRGILIPALMPSCQRRTKWLSYFENLSRGNTDLCKDINCWIYCSPGIYEWKFAQTIKLLLPKATND